MGKNESDKDDGDMYKYQDENVRQRQETDEENRYRNKALNKALTMTTTKMKANYQDENI